MSRLAGDGLPAQHRASLLGREGRAERSKLPVRREGARHRQGRADHQLTIRCGSTAKQRRRTKRGGGESGVRQECTTVEHGGLRNSEGC
ncbi:hypothetical protein ACRAWG_16395 [Methylobacterium sp. P31]